MSLSDLLNLSPEEENVPEKNKFDQSTGTLSLDDDTAMSSMGDSSLSASDDIKDEDGVIKDNPTISFATDADLQKMSTEKLFEKRQALLFLSDGQNAKTRETVTYFSAELDKIEKILTGRGQALA